MFFKDLQKSGDFDYISSDQKILFLNNYKKVKSQS